MELGKKIYQLRKLSGMTQEQLAEKLNISRQTLSKWENGTGMPDVESVVRLSALFHTSLDELLLEEGENSREEKAQITLEDMMQINARNRKMNLLLCAGLLFLAVGIILAAFEQMLETTTVSLEYMLYRYMATGRYQSVPVNYVRLMVPAVLAGAVGIGLCFCYFLKNRRDAGKRNREKKEQRVLREEQKNMKKYKYAGLVSAVLVLVLAGAVFVQSGREKSRKESSENLLGEIIEGLGDEEQFSLRDIGEKGRVLFTTDQTYDDGNGHNAAMYCSVYYADGGELYALEEIESPGTAYPVSYGEKCIYTASGHSITVYSFDHENRRWSTQQYEEIFDEDGNASYECITDGTKTAVSEKDYLEVMEDYGESTVVNFGYGASDNPG